MGVGRALYVLIFPLVFTLIGLILSFITFFSGYKSATALKNIHFMTLDLSNIKLGGQQLSSILSSENIHTAYTIAVNGWCYGSSPSNITACETPSEPFYFNFEEILESAGLKSVMNVLPDEVSTYNSISKGATYAIWACFLVAIVLSFLTFVTGFFAMCSTISGRFSEFFATIGFIASVIGAGIATGVYYIYTKKINDAVSDLGVKATLDTSGLGCAWGTVAALLIADILYVIAGCCCVQTRTKYIHVPEKGEYVY